MLPVQSLFAERALLADGWASDVRVEIAENGLIATVESGVQAGPHDNSLTTKALLPAAVNLHSHTFQRAMAGMSEARGPESSDSFWTWRAVMYRFLEKLTPDAVEAIAALAFMEMAEAGYAAVGEFHYLHNQCSGAPYDNPGEMSDRILSAADATGIGLTLLPVLYQFGGCDRRQLGGGQLRFGHDPDGFAALFAHCETGVSRATNADTRLGVAPHSLRAVDPEGIALCERLANGRPLHLHIAEQTVEVDEVVAATGQRPVAWLLDHHAVDARWCLIHCTHLNHQEVAGLAASGATAGLCPITEASLGDGTFEGTEFVNNGGAIGIGTDSNIDISFYGELRALEYSQRLRDRRRAIFATSDRSAGRRLFEMALAGGARALDRSSGAIAPGHLADLVAIETDNYWFEAAEGDELIDRLIFTGAPREVIRDVWSAGRLIVTEGMHHQRERIVANYRAACLPLTT